MTDKQKLARNRNFIKMRLMGFVVNKEYLTEDEKLMYEHIKLSIKNILENYDDSNTKLGVIKRTRECETCFKRIALNKVQCRACLVSDTFYKDNNI